MVDGVQWPRRALRRRGGHAGDHAYSSARGASALVTVTEWEQFRAGRYRPLKRMTAEAVLVDLGDIYPPEKIVRHGFVYESVGEKDGCSRR